MRYLLESEYDLHLCVCLRYPGTWPSPWSACGVPSSRRPHWRRHLPPPAVAAVVSARRSLPPPNTPPPPPVEVEAAAAALHRALAAGPSGPCYGLAQ